MPSSKFVVLAAALVPVCSIGSSEGSRDCDADDRASLLQVPPKRKPPCVGIVEYNYTYETNMTCTGDLDWFYKHPHFPENWRAGYSLDKSSKDAPKAFKGCTELCDYLADRYKQGLEVAECVQVAMAWFPDGNSSWGFPVYGHCYPMAACQLQSTMTMNFWKDHLVWTAIRK
eukprot:TRINITY_DN33967_c0_g1_i2.p1 TRINITY_DN33967_c0_g1~~TRINITY_DN33967_c0_g1_i2.p1  ORF type:complete len:172 (-),score=25.26 TRINITY_DN33967_c0_g1_i2:117-632(-)